LYTPRAAGRAGRGSPHPPPPTPPPPPLAQGELAQFFLAHGGAEAFDFGREARDILQAGAQGDPLRETTGDAAVGWRLLEHPVHLSHHAGGEL
jgi:hypothetical protein